VRFTRLELRNWRNFTAVDVPLGDRVFIVGPNACGKSNLLDAFRFLRDIAEPQGGLRRAVEHSSRRGVAELGSLYARRNADILIRVGVDLGAAGEWEYALRFGATSGVPQVREEVVRQGDRVVLERPSPEDRDDPSRLTQSHLEQVSTNRGFRELAAFLAGVRYLHIVPQLVRDSARPVGPPRDPYGSDFLDRLAQTPEATRRSHLRRIGEALKIAVPKLAGLDLYRDDSGTPHLIGAHEHWRARAKWQTEEQFSDGTLRLLGLLWALLDGDHPLLLEEPELSLHPAVVRHIVPMMGRVTRRARGQRRQVIVSTHSIELLDDEGIGGEETLMLVPGKGGTEARAARDVAEVRALLENGMTVGRVVLDHVAPENAEQLTLFGD